MREKEIRKQKIESIKRKVKVFLLFVILLHNALYGFIEDERIREDLLSVDALLI